MSLVNAYYRRFIQPSLFERSKDNAEIAHREMVEYLERFKQYPWACRLLGFWNRGLFSSALRTTFCGLAFSNPVCLAPGFDKHCEYMWPLLIPGFGGLGFGSVLPRPQDGNSEPRVVRVPAIQGLHNHMGMNSRGAFYAKNELHAAGKLPVPVEINIGSMKLTPHEKIAEDWCFVLNVLYPYGDLFTVNPSSPNTPGLRDVQYRLRSPLLQFRKCIEQLAGPGEEPKKFGVKLSPDLSDGDLENSTQVCQECGASYLVLGNTHLITDADGVTWGESGPAIFPRAKEMVRRINRFTEGKLPIIGCGGISNADSACEMIEAGATIIKIFTGLIYEGPMLPKVICRDMKRNMRKVGISHISQLYPKPETLHPVLQHG